MCMPNTMKKMNFSCIADADQLCALFQNAPAAMKSYQRDAMSILLFHIHIRVAESQSSYNASSLLETMCCEASDTPGNCRTTAVYSRDIFLYIPYPLVEVFLFPIFTIEKYLIPDFWPIAYIDPIEEICWMPPLPFCPSNASSPAFAFIIDQVMNHHAFMQNTVRHINRHYTYYMNLYSFYPNCSGYME